jgi:hypothetical protein
MGWRIAPDLYHAASDCFFKPPWHKDEIADPDMPMLASHHGFLPNVLCR